MNVVDAQYLKIVADATQAKRELADLATRNKLAAAAVQASWTSANLALKAAVAGFLGLAGATAASLMVISQFNKSLVHTAALGDMTAADMASLGRQIIDLAKKYGMSSTIMAEGTVVLSKAGLTMEQMTAAMEPVTQLMMANAVDFQTAAEIGVMSVNAFGRSYEDLTSMFDTSQYVTQQTLLNIEDLQQGLQYAASTAQMAGVTFEELVAMMGVLSQNAMVAGVASRSMNQMLLSLVEHADDMQRWADSMGLGVDIIKEGTVNITEIIPAFAKMDWTVEELRKSMDYFSVRGMRAWGILVQHAGDYLRLLEESSDASGVLARTAQQQATSLYYVWGRIKETLLAPFKTEEVRESLVGVMQTFQASMQNVGDTLQKVVARMVNEFAKWAPYIGPLINSLVETFSQFLWILRVGAEILSGFNGNMVMLWLIARKITGSKMLHWFNQLITAKAASAAQTKVLTAQENIYAIQLVTTKNATKKLIAQQQLKILTAQKDLERTNALRSGMVNLGSAIMGAAVGFLMLMQGGTKWTRIIGAMIFIMNTLIATYQALAIAAAAANVAMNPTRTATILAGVAAVTAGVSAVMISQAKSAASEVSTITTPKTGTIGGVEGFQRGSAVITKPMLALLHPGEAVHSANKPLSAGGVNIVIESGAVLVDHDEFFDRVERELGKRARKARGYLI